MNLLERNRHVLALLQERVLTYAQIGARFGITRQRVNQIRERYGMPTLGLSENGKRACVENSRRARAARGRLEDDVNPDNVLCAQIVEEEKLSYGAAAAVMLERYGVRFTRSRVAGAVHRARRRVLKEEGQSNA